MNILYYSSYDVSLQKGGTEAVTGILSEVFQNVYHYNCYLAYTNEIDTHFEKSHFKDKLRLNGSISKNRANLSKFIEENKIEIVIVQGSYPIIDLLDYIRTNKHLYFKIIFVHHYNPGAEVKFWSFERTRILLKESRKISETIKKAISLILYPFFKWMRNIKYRKSYFATYQKADKVVLLSERFMTDFMKYGRIDTSEKFVFIPNPLTFNSYIEESSLKNKERIVLIVSRLEEYQKRISLALKIWKQVEQSPHSSNWRLVIVGHGSSTNHYKNMVSRFKLKRVSFEGVQKPEDYYRKSSLFMMTSLFEGWGLTLTESQQMGVVPLAFNTYASLHDIIKSHYNGIIIEDKDVRAYTDNILSLMQDEEKRFFIGKNGVESSKQFSKNKVAEKWIDLFKQIK